MSSLIEDLLVAVRPESSKTVLNLQPVNALEAVSSLLCDACSVGGEDVDVVADPDRLRQIIRNLTQNSHRYGGEQRGFHVFSTDEQVLIEAIDNGAGVAPEDVEHLFEPLRSGKNADAESLGMGLSVSRGLALQMGGDLTYHREGGETIFRLALPKGPQPELG